MATMAETDNLSNGKPLSNRIEVFTAEELVNSNVTSPESFQYRDQHDIHDTDATYQQGNSGDGPQQ